MTPCLLAHHSCLCFSCLSLSCISTSGLLGAEGWSRGAAVSAPLCSALRSQASHMWQAEPQGVTSHFLLFLAVPRGADHCPYWLIDASSTHTQARGLPSYSPHVSSSLAEEVVWTVFPFCTLMLLQMLDSGGWAVSSH